MRPWDTFSAREADDYDYAGLAEALQPDRDLLDHGHWRRDFKTRYGDELDDDALDRHAGLASAVLGAHPDSTPEGGTSRPLADAPAAAITIPAPGPQVRDRDVWVKQEGTVSRIGWEDPNDPTKGYGYRVYVSRPDGLTDVYAHMDPNSVRYRVGDQLLQRFYLGRYADPTNGRSTGPHLHYGTMNANGEWIDPGADTPVINGMITRRHGMQRHPILGVEAMHQGIDIQGRYVIRSDPYLP